MADGEPAELEIGEEGLHVADRDLAGRGIADMADRGVAREPRDHVLRAEILADMAKAAVGMELLAVIGDDAGRLLAAMLQRVQAERGQCRRLGMAPHAKHPAFFVRVVVIDRLGAQHARASQPCLTP